MSAMNEGKSKGKPGRPRKITDVAPGTAPVKIETQNLARQAVEEIMSQAAEKAKVDLVSDVSIEGAKTTASSHDNLDLGQEDYIPGTRVLDIQMVPKWAYDEDLGKVRRVGLPDDYHYCWVHTDKITQFRIMSYKFCQYNGGAQSGLADRGFQGTGIFEKTFDNHVRNGDMLLMWVDNRRWEQIAEDDRVMREKFETAATDEIHNDGYRRGIRTFKEEQGAIVYN